MRFVLVILLLVGCRPLDSEAQARAIVNRWVFLGETVRFLSEPDCTAAAFRLRSDSFRRTNGARLVRTVRDGLPYLDAGEPVVFLVPDVSPNEVSEQLMSVNLFKGLSVLGTFMGAARRCMDDPLQADAAMLLSSPDAVLIFDPETYVMALAHGPSRIVIYLRIKV